MNPKLKELIEKRAGIAAQMSELANSAPMPPEVLVKFNAMDDEQKGIKTQIDAMTRAAELDAETRRTTRPPEGQPGGGSDAAAKAKEEEEAYRAAYRSYLKYGEVPTQFERGVSTEERSLLMKRRTTVKIEQRDMGEGGPPFGAYPGSTTGFFVPVGFVNKIEDAMKWYGDMLGVADIMETATGQPLPYPTDNDTTVSGELVTEGTQVSTADVSLSQTTFGAFKFSTKLVKVSLELLQDSAFDIEKFLTGKFGERLGRILNTKFTVGVGTTEPQGIVVGSTVGLSSGTAPAIIGDDNATTPDPTKQVGYIDLVNLEHSVDKAYRKGAKYMLHDTTLAFIKQLKDKYGRPLWVPGMAVNAPDTINGYAYSINNDLATLAASNKTVLFGALSKYMVRRVKDLSVIRLSERFADYGQVAFLGFARYDGQLLDAGTHPVKYIQQHA